MDTDRLLRIFNRMMESHGDVFIGGFGAIIALVLLVVVTRILKNRKSRAKKPAQEMMSAPMMDGAENDADMDVDLDFTSEADLDLARMDDFDDAEIIADMKAGEPLVIDELDADLAHSFNVEADELDDLDDITIPKIGEAPPPKQSRFFSASWLGKKDKSNAPTISLNMTPSPTDEKEIMAHDNRAMNKSAAECARLGEIERRLMALRELYEAGLIAPEVYVVKAREFAAQV